MDWIFAISERLAANDLAAFGLVLCVTLVLFGAALMWGSIKKGGTK